MFGVIIMVETLPCNSYEVTNTKEAFCFLFKFTGPDGAEKKVYVVMSPAGAKTLAEMTTKGVTEYEGKYGTINVESWKSKADPSKTDNTLAR